MIKFIATRTGYVESNSTGLVVWSIENKKGFKTVKSALDSLARYLAKKYEYDEMQSEVTHWLPQCCVGKTTPFCNSCGRRLKAQSFDLDLFMDFYIRLAGTNCDSFGEFDLNDVDIWNPWSFPKGLRSPKEIHSIGETAEEILGELVEKIFNKTPLEKLAEAAE
ncbi:MAG: hypothetical protein MN733_20640 [Nitrososphaera sp.]|nr:hypothetical protein [Nitrososphaera sp.]